MTRYWINRVTDKATTTSEEIDWAIFSYPWEPDWEEVNEEEFEVFINS